LAVDTAISGINPETEPATFIRLLCMKVYLLCEQDDVTGSYTYCDEARQLYGKLVDPNPVLEERICQAEIRVCRIDGNNHRLGALAKRVIELSEQHQWRWTVVNRFYLAEYYYEKADYQQAENLYKQLIEESHNAGYQRAPINGWIFLFDILMKKDDFVGAVQYLQHAQERAEVLNHRRFIAKTQQMWSHYWIRRGELDQAQEALTKSVELYQRLGMRRELAEAREELARLEAQMAEAAE
jgi:tetratricopeptide (TPR) repeat protein